VNSIEDPPIADFSWTADGLAVTFTDESVSGDAPNVTYIPNTDYYGNDSFTFSVSDGEFFDTGLVSITVNSIEDPPIADFSWTADGLAVTFTDESMAGDASIDYWSWNFGDGNAAAYQNPTHTYDISGTYFVQLYVQDINELIDTTSHAIILDESAGSEEMSSIPDKFDLHQNYPNPFNPKTKIVFDVPKISKINIEIFNIYGQKIQTLMNNEIQPGLHSLVWDGRDKNEKELSSGIYFYRMRSDSFFKSQKLILLK